MNRGWTEKEKENLQEQFKSMILDLGLNQVKAAKRCGINKDTACRWYKILDLDALKEKRKQGQLKTDKGSRDTIAAWTRVNMPNEMPHLENILNGFDNHFRHVR